MSRKRAACANTPHVARIARRDGGGFSMLATRVSAAALVAFSAPIGGSVAAAQPVATSSSSAAASTTSTTTRPAPVAEGSKALPTAALQPDDPTLQGPTPTFIQYGVGFSGDTVVSAGPICSSVSTPCILGDGAGLVASLGVVKDRAWYWGGKYELTRRDPGKLYRLATLQEIRFEARRYQDTGKDLRAFAVGGLGVALYGDLWSVDTFGPEALLGLGAELELSRKSLLLLSANYRVARFSAFNDTAGSSRHAGFTQFFGLQITLEARDLF